ncbi:hypothetical protein HY345_00300 [Candidatus Microgenomates bacterium]|nr:hypothetical protein [Candidatus Microgenomates bacterium]
MFCKFEVFEHYGYHGAAAAVKTAVEKSALAKTPDGYNIGVAFEKHEGLHQQRLGGTELVQYNNAQMPITDVLNLSAKQVDAIVFNNRGIIEFPQEY